MKKLLALLLTLVLVLGMVSACAKPADISDVPSGPNPDDPGANAEPAPPGSDGPSEPVTTDEPIETDDSAVVPAPQPQIVGVTTLSAYEELYDKLELNRGGVTGGIVLDDAVMEEAVPEAPEAEGSTSSDSAAGELGSVNGDYSETNVQVEGVDEADVVKTDGAYIYILRDNGWLTILSADGENSAQLSNTQVCFTEESKTETAYEYLHEYAENLYLSGDRVVVLYSHNRWGYGESDDAYFDEYHQGARIYDVSDPAAPVLVADVGQDGWLTDSRMMDGVLYVLTNYHVYSGVEREQPETYIPRTYNGGEAALMAVDCIYLPEAVESNSYLVVQAIDVASGESLSELAVLGGSSYVYMNRSNLFVAGVRYEQVQSEPFTEDIYTVTEYTEQRVTNILRFAVNGGSVTLEATGAVSGSPLSQYSFDEYNGYLRIVTTEYANTYRVYEDEQRDFINYEWLDSGTTNGLYVLDETLQIVGSVTGLGEDERVYSVRFDGTVGYFVTFRETDPLFAVDLTDPTAPQVMSELKIPGFSSYLHVWDDGLLFGLGQMADETGATQGLKLAMYDVSDPFNVTELLTQEVGADYSPAENNPRAVCIDPAKNLIGFACEDYSNWNSSSYYVLYRFVDGVFVELGRYELTDWTYYTRGLYIGSEFYIVGESELVVVSLDTGDQLARIPIPHG